MKNLDLFFKIIVILALLYLATYVYMGVPNGSDTTIKAIHEDTTQRNILQKDTNDLLGDIKELLDNGLNVTVDCED